MDEQLFLDIARPIMSLPTAPFHEHFVVQAIQNFATRCSHIELTSDPLGNLLLLYDGRQKRSSKDDYLIATAHLDHPGLAWTERLSRQEFAFEKLGGVENALACKSRVRIFSLDLQANQRAIRGEIIGFIEGDEDRPLAFRVRVNSKAEADRLGPDCFAMWDLRAWDQRGRRLHCRACDDLGGVAVGLSYLDELARHRVPVRAGLLLTRAEEVGFGGMTGAVKGKHLDENAFYINIECSSIRAGAVLGQGPVVRVGDFMWVFDPYITGGLVEVARRLIQEQPGFRFQRKLMDSGSCEATVLMSAGYRTGAVALPLDNYHNIGTDKLKPEIIHLDDALNLVDLLVHLAGQPGGVARTVREATVSLNRHFAQRFKHHGPRLKKPLTSGS